MLKTSCPASENLGFLKRQVLKDLFTQHAEAKLAEGIQMHEVQATSEMLLCDMRNQASTAKGIFRLTKLTSDGYAVIADNATS